MSAPKILVLLEEISFEGADNQAVTDGVVAINAKYVNDHLADLANDEDLSRYIL
jgi:ATP-dependent HslUV protease ATP-binding subunit HslU